MHSFHYQDGFLHCEETSLQSLADRHGTPLYVYSAHTIRDHYQRLDTALGDLDHHIAYAVKANSNLSILRLLADLGSGFDIVSGGELYRVIQAGGDPATCTFAGVGKTRAEIEYALEQTIYCFNVESIAELEFINTVAGEMGVVAPVAVRVNPNVDARTHRYISTGKSGNKFGVDYEFVSDIYERIENFPHLLLRGIQMHIGSQLQSVRPFVEAVERVAPLARELKADHGIEFFSIGGGVGIIYEDCLPSGSPAWWETREEKPLTIEQYASEITPILRETGLRILFEPGRYIVGNAGVLLASCLYEKRGTTKTFKVVDAGMNDLIRPALYEGHHDIVPVRESANVASQIVDVVGPICETGDFFCENREVADFKQGDIIALMSAGAYGFTMASNYNSRPMPAEVLVDGADARIIRKRQSLGDLISLEL